MARELYWDRSYNTSFNWQVGTQGNQFLHSISPGETLTRLVLSLRFWANAVNQTGPTAESLYVPYVFGILWADAAVIPNPNLVTLQTVMQDYPDYLLWVERFTMRDAYTPAKYNAVNLGWIDDRPSMQVDVDKQRKNNNTNGNVINVNLLYQANSTLEGDPLQYRPLCTSSALIRSIDQ